VIFHSIERWFRRLQRWWWKPLFEAMDDAYRSLDRRLDGHETHLMAIGQRAGIPMATTKVPQARRWGCGHTNVSGADWGSGATECVNCHQKRYVAQ
jgi:hypothetical protein